jgi:hypothetical protein
MKRIIIASTLVLATAASAAAYGGFFSPGAVGTVIPAPATAYLTCYAVDSGYTLAAANTSREDILATFVAKDVAGITNSVCFLRPPTQTGEWHVALPQPPQPTGPPAPPPPAPNACSGFPGFVLGKHGGCVPPSHPDAQLNSWSNGQTR